VYTLYQLEIFVGEIVVSNVL